MKAELRAHELRIPEIRHARCYVKEERSHEDSHVVRASFSCYRFAIRQGRGWRRRRLLSWLLCCSTSRSGGCVQAALPRSGIRLGGWLLGSLGTALRLERGLLGASPVSWR